MFIHYSEPNMGVQLELNYSQRGWRENLDSSGHYARRFNYVEFPILSHFDIGRKNIKFLITFGPCISYMVSDKENVDIVDPELI